MTCNVCATSSIGQVIVCTTATRPTGGNLYEGRVIYETDTGRSLLYDGVGWIIMSEPSQSLTVTPRQNAANLTYSGQAASYHRSDGWCDVTATMTITSAGAVGTAFDCALTLPAAVVPAFGTFVYYDAGNVLYVGVAGLNAAGDNVSFTTDGTNSTLGINPSFAAANTDSIGFNIRYRMNTRYL